MFVKIQSSNMIEMVCLLIYQYFKTWGCFFPMWLVYWA